MHDQQTLRDAASERIVLAGIFQFGEDSYIDVSDLINTNSFCNTQNQLLFKCLELVVTKKNKVDIPAVIAASSELGVYDSVAKNKNDIEFLKGLSTIKVHQENVRSYAKKLAKLDFARQAQDKMQKAYHELGTITGNETIDHILGIPETAAFELVKELNGKQSDIPVNFGKGGSELIQHLIDNPCENIGIPTPYPIYNKAIGGGLRRKGVNLIGARSKTGKSIIGKETGIHVALNLDIPVLYLDTEMEREEQLYRVWASLARIPIDDIETGKFGKNPIQIGKLKEVQARVEKSRYFHKAVAGKPFSEILSIIRRWIVQEVGYTGTTTNDCLIIYDYFKMMDSEVLKDMKEYEALGYQLMALSDFSKEYDFPCLSFVQMNRDMQIAQSDRLIWFAHSYSQFYVKEIDEINTDGPELGNRRLETMYCRFGGGLTPGDHINIQMEGQYAALKELGTKFAPVVNKNEFEIGESDDENEEDGDES